MEKNFGPFKNHGLLIVVLQGGFVYIGEVETASLDGVPWLRISGTRNLRVWGTTAGLGQLATGGPTKETKMDVTGTIYAPVSSLLHFMQADAKVWKGK